MLLKSCLPALAALALLAPAALADDAKTDDGFTPLFDGETLDGWKNPYTWGEAKVVDGEIHLKADKKFFLVTEKEYDDFIFEGDVHLPEGPANSGFMFRANVEPNKVYGYQSEVDGSPRGWSGGLYDEGRRGWFVSPKRGDKESEAAFKKRAGDAFKRNGWNTYRITAQGDHITIAVNGVVVSDFKDDVDAAGPIGIQHHGEKGAVYRFRNLRVKPLKSGDAAK
ncbi:3-keto-disaccharide hydrolase [Alienimonas californiensis]|uniref:3-keto-alpha-glucoside-1,2-lyase/3-keto-2-hydroxy-glucal hydratase domain-containing protein n=1 Tax=Alienimonas californiensis TaxID=2527989 RepID=A0A517P6K1_9PLAN|nr:DUF1080 domain-containing protein [Alienimonas californiensis]QDT15010.1 hypothetical protein CA12_10900 [Alienimonas californiensis]